MRSCHRNPEYGNRPTDAALPSLSGQSKIFLINQLVYFPRQREIQSADARARASTAATDDIEALAVYFREM